MRTRRQTWRWHERAEEPMSRLSAISRQIEVEREPSCRGGLRISFCTRHWTAIMNVPMEEALYFSDKKCAWSRGGRSEGHQLASVKILTWQNLEEQYIWCWRVRFDNKGKRKPKLLSSQESHDVDVTKMFSCDRASSKRPRFYMSSCSSHTDVQYYEVLSIAIHL